MPGVLVSYCITSHPKLCNFKQHPHVSYLTVVQVRSLGSLLTAHKVKSRYQLGLALIWRLRKESTSNRIRTVGRIRDCRTDGHAAMVLLLGWEGLVCIGGEVPWIPGL